MFRIFSALLVSFLLAATAAVPTDAQENEMPKLGIAPVGASGPFFDLTMEPGERLEFSVRLENFGTTKARARTYAADGYTILNGGFGAKLADEPISGTTKWLDYEADVIELESGSAVERGFAVSVPEKTKPGEYITSLAIENADPIQGTGGVTINQITRQVVAVSITVPGPQNPKLKITGATYELLPSYAHVLVALNNNGNVRLKPSGEVVVRDSADTEVTRYSLAMDSFYAHTKTAIEVILLQPLEPGDYMVSVKLTDEERELTVEETSLPLTVSNANSSGTPVPETQVITVESVAVNELRDPSSNTLQGVELVVGIDNPALPVANARLTLHVTKDGQTVEDFVLGSSLSFPGGKAEVRQRYLPISGWTSGVWAFSVTLDVVDPATGDVVELTTVQAETTVTVS